MSAYEIFRNIMLYGSCGTLIASGLYYGFIWIKLYIELKQLEKRDD